MANVLSASGQRASLAELSALSDPWLPRASLDRERGVPDPLRRVVDWLAAQAWSAGARRGFVPTTDQL
jgi:hypothetical protein